MPVGPIAKPRAVAGPEAMLRFNTPVEDHTAEFGLLVKREDLACLPPGPPFSKTRGVFAWCAKRPEAVIGVLDTFHSQAGHAVARACQVLGKECVNFYPHYKADEGKPVRSPQERARALGAELVALPAGRSCILYHAAKKQTLARGGVMIPNALKLPESVTETAKEVGNCPRVGVVLIPSSSATIAAGVIKGFVGRATTDAEVPTFVAHLGYSRSHDEVRRYISEAAGVDPTFGNVVLVDEGYSYKDVAKPGETPPWPCSPWYDLKCVRWWLREGRAKYGEALLWNVG